MNPARAVEARARAFARLGDPVREIAALRAWVAATPKDFEPRLRLVERLIALSRPAEAAVQAAAGVGGHEPQPPALSQVPLDALLSLAGASSLTTFFWPPFLKSVSYQPLPLSRNPTGEINFFRLG